MSINALCMQNNIPQLPNTRVYKSLNSVCGHHVHQCTLNIFLTLTEWYVEWCPALYAAISGWMPSLTVGHYLVECLACIHGNQVHFTDVCRWKIWWQWRPVHDVNAVHFWEFRSQPGSMVMRIIVLKNANTDDVAWMGKPQELRFHLCITVQLQHVEWWQDGCAGLKKNWSTLIHTSTFLSPH